MSVRPAAVKTAGEAPCISLDISFLVLGIHLALVELTTYLVPGSSYIGEQIFIPCTRYLPRIISLFPPGRPRPWSLGLDYYSVSLM